MTETLTLLAYFCSITLFGGMMLYSFGFAPFLFKALEPEMAGRTIRRAFPAYYLFVIGGGVVSAAFLLPLDMLGAVLMVAVAAIGVIARQGLMPMINDARDRQLAGETVAKSRFAWLHGASVLLNFVQLGLIAWVLIRFL